MTQSNKDNIKQICMDYAEKVKHSTAQQCYLECIAVECGEGECARAIRTKFNLEEYNPLKK